METVSSHNQIITIDELSIIIKMDKRTIQNRLSRGLPLPPSFKLPQSKNRLWRYSDVMAWIDSVADAYIQEEQQQRDKLEELTDMVRKGRSNQSHVSR